MYISVSVCAYIYVTLIVHGRGRKKNREKNVYICKKKATVTADYIQYSNNNITIYSVLVHNIIKDIHTNRVVSVVKT